MLLLRWVLFLAWLFPFVLTHNLYAKSQEAIGQTFLEWIVGGASYLLQWVLLLAWLFCDFFSF